MVVLICNRFAARRGWIPSNVKSARVNPHTRTHPYAQVHTYGLYLANQNDVDLAVSGEGSFSTYVNGVERRQQILTVNVSGPIPPRLSL